MGSISKCFPLQGSFLDPLLTKDNKPYAPVRYKELVKERYLISKNIHTSYSDVGKMTPIERSYILEFISDEIKRSQKLIDEQISNRKKNKDK